MKRAVEQDESHDHRAARIIQYKFRIFRQFRIRLRQMAKGELERVDSEYNDELFNALAKEYGTLVQQRQEKSHKEAMRRMSAQLGLPFNEIDERNSEWF